MGGAKRRVKLAVKPMVVDTPGGRIHVHWDTEASATPNGQLAFCAEILQKKPAGHFALRWRLYPSAHECGRLVCLRPWVLPPVLHAF